MGWIITSSGKQKFSYPIPSTSTKTDTLNQVVETEGDHDHQIVIDASSPNVDKSHIYLHGGIGVDEYFIRCYNPIVENGEVYGKDVITIDGHGNMKCNVITSFTTDILYGEITNIEESLEDTNDKVEFLESDLLAIEDQVGANIISISGHQTIINHIFDFISLTEYQTAFWLRKGKRF